MENTEVILELVKKYGKIRALFVETYQQLSELRDLGKNNKLSMYDETNICYILRETSKFLNDLRKEFDGVEGLLQNACCAKYIVANTANPNNSEPIKTGVVTGTPKVHINAKIPRMSKNPDAYWALMEHFNVPKELIGKDLLRPHWPTLKDYLSELAEKGEPLPNGVNPNDTYPVYSLILRMNKDLDELISELEDIYIANEAETEEGRKEICIKLIEDVCRKKLR